MCLFIGNIRCVRFAEFALGYGALQKCKEIWRTKNIPIHMKVQFYHAIALSVVLYNSETWVLTAEDKALLSRFHQNALRRILGFTRNGLGPELVTPEDYRLDALYLRDKADRYNVPIDILEIILERKARWVAHHKVRSGSDPLLEAEFQRQVAEESDWWCDYREYLLREDLDPNLYDLRVPFVEGASRPPYDRSFKGYFIYVQEEGEQVIYKYDPREVGLGGPL